MYFFLNIYPEMTKFDYMSEKIRFRVTFSVNICQYLLTNKHVTCSVTVKFDFIIYIKIDRSVHKLTSF
jgi:hypothetical protein